MKRQENLNLAWWHRKMVNVAVTRYKTKKEAAKALGITPRTLTDYLNSPENENRIRISPNAGR